MSDKQYNNELRGVLFVNDRRQTDSHPHYQGQCEIDSVPHWLNAWVKEPAKGGADYLSLAFRRKDASKDAPKPAKDDPNLRGALFVNEKKDSDEKPDYTGRCQIDGVQYWLTAWIKAPREAGEGFISIQFEKAGAGAARTTGRLDAKALLAQAKARIPGESNPPPLKAAPDDFSDDIPFIWAFALPIAGLLAALIYSAPVIA
jgi:uncharacterized protein (DUF736 family)